ncbi:hypothetical protein [Haloarchaeobius litoreus]|uniref:EamA domain-containing protein n=1 Tax=Haloarchaeobius litoreus TaxID=755306 RepID=A0ABD6DFP4_9EURY|nr:hypothetical protein [Haloarchaeobius litoreus]
MSLSAVALYVLARELPDTHTKATLSFAPVLFIGTLLQFATADPTVHAAGLAAVALGGLGAVLVVSDGLRKRLTFAPDIYDTSS